MAFDYSGLKATAERLLERFGRTATLVEPTTADSGDDPWNPSSGGSESSIILVEGEYSIMERDGTVVQTGDKKWFVSTDGTEPTAQHTIKLDGDTYNIVNVKPLNPGGTKLMFTVQARV